MKDKVTNQKRYSIRVKEGVLIADEEKIVERWEEYFNELLNRRYVYQAEVTDEEEDWFREEIYDQSPNALENKKNKKYKEKQKSCAR